VIAISHRPLGLDAFDRILFLRGGRLSLVDPRSLETLLRPDAAPPARASAARGAP
jgi:hypothetical protein